MNIVNVLVAHHGVLRQLYGQSQADPAMFPEFIRHLVVHHTMEEKYFYELLEGYGQAHEKAMEGVNEHHIIELIIKDAERFPRDHERFAIKVESLGEYTTHHLDEEETVIFPMAERVMPAEALTTLGGLFTEAKDKLLSVVLPEVPAGIAPGDMGGKRAGKPSAKSGAPAGEEKAASGAGLSYVRGLGIGSLRR